MAEMLQFGKTESEWLKYARSHDIHPVDINIFVSQDEFPNCHGKFGSFAAGTSVIPHFLGLCGRGGSDGNQISNR